MDPKQNPTQPVQPAQPNPSVSAQTTRVAQQPQVPTPVQQPVAPIGGAKESPVVGPIKAEWVSPSTPEIVLPKEVKDAGVETQPLMPQISAAGRQEGVQMGHQNLPTPTVTTEILGVNTPRGVLQQLQQAHKSVKDSLSWLVRLVIKEQDREKVSPIE